MNARSIARSISRSMSARMVSRVGSVLIGVPSFDAPTGQGRWRTSVAGLSDVGKTVVNEHPESRGEVLHRAVTARLSRPVDK